MSNKCEIVTYFGNVGSGKSTIAASIAKKALKKGIPVFSNFAIKGCYILDPKNDLGHFSITNAVIIIDECGIEYNNREFKTNFKDVAHLTFWKLFRHAHLQIHVFSQGWNDMDLKIRTLSTRLYLVQRSIIPFIFTRCPIHVKFGINPNTKEPCDVYSFPHFLLRPFVKKYTFGPLYWKMFNSFELPYLPDKDWIKYE